MPSLRSREKTDCLYVKTAKMFQQYSIIIARIIHSYLQAPKNSRRACPELAEGTGIPARHPRFICHLFSRWLARGNVGEGCPTYELTSSQHDNNNINRFS
jgi:hypothetical protein